jgi:hypothetical protein
LGADSIGDYEVRPGHARKRGVVVTLVILTCADADVAPAVKRPSSVQNAKPTTGRTGDDEPRLWGRLPITPSTVGVEILLDRMVDIAWISS